MNSQETHKPTMIVILTGATSGIGESFARQLAAKAVADPKKTPRIGLAITGRNALRLKSLADELNRTGLIDCLPITADLADPDAPQRIVQDVLNRWGRIDVLVNNAGYGLPHLFHKTDPADIQAQIQVDLTAPILLTRLALPHLLKSPAGRVIQVSSSISTIAYPIFGAYGACKSGLSYFTDALRRELSGTRVAVTLVEPGPIKTEFLSRAMEGLEKNDTERGFIENWPSWVFGTPQQVAAKMIKCLDRPKRRISVTKTAVWPMRLGGLLFQIFPPLGDWFVSKNLRDAGVSPRSED